MLIWIKDVLHKFRYNVKGDFVDSGRILNALVDKLCAHVRLSPADVDLLTEACQNHRVFPARTDLIREGDKPGPGFVILEGWACRYKLLPEGTRQITSFLMPGDACDLHATVSNAMEHSIATLTTARIALVPRGIMETLIETRPALARAFWWTQLVDEDTLRAWIVSMGRRNGLQRVAHLMCDRALAWLREGEPVAQDPIDPGAARSLAEPDAHGQAALLLTESLLHMLVENRGLTNAQAVDVVHTAALVKVEVAEDAGESRSRMIESLVLLKRMEVSFQADDNDGPV